MSIPLPLAARLAPLGVGFVEFYVDQVGERPLALEVIKSELKSRRLIGSVISGADVGVLVSALVRIAMEPSNHDTLITDQTGALHLGSSFDTLCEELSSVFGCEVFEGDGSFWWDSEAGASTLQSLSVIAASTPLYPLSMLVRASGGHYSVVEGQAVLVPPLGERLESYTSLDTLSTPLMTFVKAGARRSIYLSEPDDFEYSVAAHNMPEGTPIFDSPAGSPAARVSKVLAYASSVEVSEDSPWWSDGEDPDVVQIPVDQDERPLEIQLMERFDQLTHAPEHGFFAAFGNLAQLPTRINGALADFEHNGVVGLKAEVESTSTRQLSLDGIRFTPVTTADTQNGDRTRTALALMYPNDANDKLPLSAAIRLSPIWRTLVIIFGVVVGGTLAGSLFGVGPLTGAEMSTKEQAFALFAGLVLLSTAFSGIKGISAPRRARVLVERAIADGAFIPAHSSQGGGQTLHRSNNLSDTYRTETEPTLKPKRGSDDDNPPPGMIKI